MTIQSLDESWEEQVSLGDNGFSIDRVWMAKGYQSATQVRLSVPVARGEQHPEQPGAYATDIKVDRLSASGVFKVVVTYRGPEFSDPTLEPAKIRIGTRWIPYVTCFNGDGQLIVNSAGDPVYFDHERPLRTFHLSRVLAFLPSWVGHGTGKVNDGTVYVFGSSFPKHSLRIADIEAEDFYLGGTQFWRVSAGVDFDPATHKKKAPDSGYSEIDLDYQGRKIKVPIASEDGSPVTERVLLGPDGRVPRDAFGRKRWDLTDDERKLMVIEETLDEGFSFNQIFYG